MSGIRQLLNGLGIPQEALGCFFEGQTLAQYKNISPELMEAMYAHAYSLYEINQLEQAGDVFRFLCSHDHTCAKYFAGMGACYFQMKDYVTAEPLLEQAIALDPSDPCPMMNLAFLHSVCDQTSQAHQWCHKVIERTHDNPAFQKEHQAAENILNQPLSSSH